MSGPHPEELIQVDPDIELLGDYLARELDPAQVAEVERRLVEDEAFRTRAAPLIALWSIPPRWKREPIPRETLEKHWDAFTRRAGFTHQRRKRRRRWIIYGVLLLPVVFLTLLAIDVVNRALAGWESPIVGPRVVELRDGTRVDLDSGATVTPADDMIAFGTMLRVQLDGSATFHMARVTPPTVRVLVVQTQHGSLAATNTSFRVTQVNDSVFVQVFRRAATASAPQAMPSQVLVRPRGDSSLILAEGNSAIVGRAPTGMVTAAASVRSDSAYARAKAFATFYPDVGRSLVNARSQRRVSLADGTRVELEGGALLFALGQGAYELEGTARFQRTAGTLKEAMVRTPAAVILMPMEANLAVRVAGDTTVATLRYRPKAGDGPTQRDEILVVSADSRSNIHSIQVMEGQTVRWVRGQQPVVTTVPGSVP